MNADIILAGVGGQGILSVAEIMADVAVLEENEVKYCETHGMAQRGGSVMAHLRIADHPIHSDLIPRGVADMILSLEPLEALRYLEFLGPTGMIVTAAECVHNFDNYPDEERLLAHLHALPQTCVVEAETLARRAGSTLAANMVMAGAASRHLALDPALIETRIAQYFARKGPRVVEVNLSAFRLGREVPSSVAA